MSAEQSMASGSSKLGWRSTVLRVTIVTAMGMILLCTATWLFLRFEYGPRLRASQEANACQSLRNYIVAQEAFRRAACNGKGEPTFADALPKLRKLLPAEFIAAHGSRGTPYHGYIFREMKTIGGVPINWTSDFAICAIPARYGVTGFRTFIVTSTGFICGRDCGYDGRPVDFVDDYPADLMGTGWFVGAQDTVDDGEAKRKRKDDAADGEKGRH
jgi:hypothetical protein